MKKIFTFISLMCWLTVAVCETYICCKGVPFTFEPFQILNRKIKPFTLYIRPKINKFGINGLFFWN